MLYFRTSSWELLKLFCHILEWYTVLLCCCYCFKSRITCFISKKWFKPTGFPEWAVSFNNIAFKSKLSQWVIKAISLRYVCTTYPVWPQDPSWCSVQSCQIIIWRLNGTQSVVIIVWNWLVNRKSIAKSL